MPGPEIPVHTNVLPRIAPLAGLRVREDSVFTDASGVEKAAIRRLAEQDLQQASEVLSRLLQPSEAVLYVSRGAFMPSTGEKLLDHHAVMAVGALLVLTNSRLIVLRTVLRPKASSLDGWAWDQGILTVEWANLVEAVKKGSLIGYLVLKDQKGQREQFFRMRWRDSKKLGVLLGVLVPQGSGVSMPVAPTAPGFVSLCPKCLAGLSAGLYQCAQCGLTFKDEKSLLRRALLIPAGAYFYTGQTYLGVMTGFAEIVLIILLVMTLLEATGLVTVDALLLLTPSLFFVFVAFLLLFFALSKFTGLSRARRRIRKFIPA